MHSQSIASRPGCLPCVKSKPLSSLLSSQDTALLSYVVQALYTSPTDPELFQRLLLSLLTVSRSHPQNLVPLLDKDRLKEFCTAKRMLPPENAGGEGEGESEKKGESPSPDVEQDFLTKLNAVFWELIEQTPVTPAVTSVATPGAVSSSCHSPHCHRWLCCATYTVACFSAFIC